MLVPPRYTLTSKITELLQSIEASREVIESVTIPPEVETNIRRQSTLKSSLFSARIEGNELTLDEISGTSRTQQKAEVYNILKALNWLHARRKKDITANDILNLHTIALDGLIHKDNLGKWRRNMEAIFNSAGIAIYMPPPPRQIEPMVVRLIKYINSPRERLSPIRAMLAHFTFEKIHPFLDGNGRVGRLLIQKILVQTGYGMKGLVSLEEYLDDHRNEYYRGLEEPEKDVTDYLIFMLTALESSAKRARELVVAKQQAEVEDFLLPRRAEILRIIKDQKMVNFDQIHRRFLKVNARTLRYDLKKLTDGGFVRKLGTTRGVYYEAKG